MNTPFKKLVSVIILVGVTLFALPSRSAPDFKTNLLTVQVEVDGTPVAATSEEKVDLGTFPRNIGFRFGSAPNSTYNPIRLRYKLDGYETNWHQVNSQMTFTVRFYNDTGDQAGQDVFPVAGDSGGWNGNLKTSPLTHRREAVTVPAQASQLWIVISSAGAPASVGIYVVDNLQVTRVVTNGAPTKLLQSPLDSAQKDCSDEHPPVGWIRDGTHPSMAKIIEIGPDPSTKAFAILDDDPFSHAEWHNIMAVAPKVKPGDHLLVEWDEMFSIGAGSFGAAYYDSLPAGKYHFLVEAITAMGDPTGVEASVAVVVPLPFWKQPWSFWTGGLIVVLLTAAIARYLTWQRMRQEMTRLKSQQALEQERLRIAHDIHDDLGARVTQISLLSAMAQDNASFPEKAREDFGKVSRMARELVSALYETVWAVNPENDHLEALGNYLCQMVNQLCERTPLRCRFNVPELPHEVQVSSQTRHNISMAVKEAVHNIIKHGQATEVSMRLAFADGFLDVWVEDNGVGFEPEGRPGGYGLTNMKKRLANIGGHCFIESQPGKGTTVRMRLAIQPLERGE